ncbi:unnamed protein product [Anisakis simplex]|uniref:Glucosamine 6-phosphate N-acetyltransferase n=1 Tax=Anisakis simplex TaxID=6269 RepID=A0A0M3JZX2_ANISI|nr:unnamed protein product [Anisakis simplex]
MEGVGMDACARKLREETDCLDCAEDKPSSRLNNNNNNNNNCLTDIDYSLCSELVALSRILTPVVDYISDDVDMFPLEVLSSLHLPLSAPKLPADLIVRPLRSTDYNHGYLQLLSQLTSVGDVSEEQFHKRFLSMQKTNPKSYYVVVLEEISSGMLVGSATLVIEWKFIHEAGCRGRTEDVVVDRRMRGKQLGKLLNFYLVELARLIGVYKMSLECKDSLIPFYEQFGFKLDQGNNFLVQRFD